MTSQCPKRRRARRTCELMAERTPCAASIGDDQRDLPKPGGCRGDRLAVRSGYAPRHRRYSSCLPPCWEPFCSSSSRRHIFRLVRYWFHLVAQFVGLSPSPQGRPQAEYTTHDIKGKRKVYRVTLG